MRGRRGHAPLDPALLGAAAAAAAAAEGDPAAQDFNLPGSPARSSPAPPPAGAPATEADDELAPLPAPHPRARARKTVALVDLDVIEAAVAAAGDDSGGEAAAEAAEARRTSVNVPSPVGLPPGPDFEFSSSMYRGGKADLRSALLRRNSSRRFSHLKTLAEEGDSDGSTAGVGSAFSRRASKVGFSVGSSSGDLADVPSTVTSETDAPDRPPLRVRLRSIAKLGEMFGLGSDTDTTVRSAAPTTSGRRPSLFDHLGLGIARDLADSAEWRPTSRPRKRTRSISGTRSPLTGPMTPPTAPLRTHASVVSSAVASPTSAASPPASPKRPPLLKRGGSLVKLPSQSTPTGSPRPLLRAKTGEFVVAARSNSVMPRPADTADAMRRSSVIQFNELDNILNVEFDNETLSTNTATTASEWQLVRPYMPTMLVDALTSDPEPTVHQEHMKAVDGVIMFADFSGFSSLTDLLHMHSPEEASDILAAALNEGLAVMVRIIIANGGDIIKFAGDAIVVFFPDEEDAAERAVTLAKVLVSTIRDRDSPMALKVGVGCGPVYPLFMGGSGARWEFSITGDALVQALSAEKLAAPNTVIVSPKVAARLDSKTVTMIAIDDHDVGAESENAFHRVHAVDSAKLQQIHVPSAMATIVVQGTARDDMTSAAIHAMRAFLPHELLQGLRQGDCMTNELRRVTIAYICMPGVVSLDKHDRRDVNFNRIDEIVSQIQSCSITFDGSINKALVDDKGFVVIAGFGTPHCRSQFDALRGVLFALDVVRRLNNQLDVEASVGIATGRVFCGVVGCRERCEYSFLGDAMNLAARLANVRPGIVLVDTPTFVAAQAGQIAWNEWAPIAIKGKTELVDVYEANYAVDQRGSSRRRLPTLQRTSSMASIASEQSDVSEGGSQSTTVAMGIGPDRGSGRIEIERSIYFGIAPYDPSQLDTEEEMMAASVRQDGVVDAEALGIYGRNDVVRQLRREVDNLKAGDPGSFVVIEGPAGIGKSVLATHLTFVAHQLEVPVHRCFCTQFTRNLPYFMWLPVLLHFLDIKGEDAATMWSDTAEAALCGLFDESETVRLEQLVDAIPYLRHLLRMTDDMGHALPDTEAFASEKTAVHAAVLSDVFQRIIARRGGSTGQCIIADNAHHLDPMSLRLLVDIMSVECEGLLVVFLWRPNSVPTAVKRAVTLIQNTRRFPLGPISEDAVAAMIGHCLEIANPPHALVTAINSRCNGVPLFVEELVQCLLESNKLFVDENQRLHFRQPQTFDSASASDTDTSAMTIDSDAESEDLMVLLGGALPGTIQDMLMSRMDCLTASQQLTCKVASVIGLMFDLGTLSAAFPLKISSRQLAANLQELVLLDFLVRISGTGYAFKHAIVQECVYKSLLHSQRADIHCAVAEHFRHESDHHPKSSEVASLVARHFAMGGAKVDALYYLNLAGSNLVETGHLCDSARFFVTAHHIGEQHLLEDPTSRRWLGVYMSRWQQIISHIEGFTAAQCWERVQGSLDVLGAWQDPDEPGFRLALAWHAVQSVVMLSPLGSLVCAALGQKTPCTEADTPQLAAVLLPDDQHVFVPHKFDPELEAMLALAAAGDGVCVRNVFFQAWALLCSSNYFARQRVVSGSSAGAHACLVWASGLVSMALARMHARACLVQTAQLSGFALAKAELLLARSWIWLGHFSAADDIMDKMQPSALSPVELLQLDLQRGLSHYVRGNMQQFQQCLQRASHQAAAVPHRDAGVIISAQMLLAAAELFNDRGEMISQLIGKDVLDDGRFSGVFSSALRSLQLFRTQALASSEKEMLLAIETLVDEGILPTQQSAWYGLVLEVLLRVMVLMVLSRQCGRAYELGTPMEHLKQMLNLLVAHLHAVSIVYPMFSAQSSAWVQLVEVVIDPVSDTRKTSVPEFDADRQVASQTLVLLALLIGELHRSEVDRDRERAIKKQLQQSIVALEDQQQALDAWVVTQVTELATASARQRKDTVTVKFQNPERSVRKLLLMPLAQLLGALGAFVVLAVALVAAWME